MAEAPDSEAPKSPVPDDGATPAETPALPPSEAPAHAYDIDKIERASSIATTMDATTGEQQHHSVVRQLSMTGANHISLADVVAVDVQIRGVAVVVDTSPSIFDPGTYPELFKDKFGKNNGEPRPKTKSLIHSVSASLQPGTLTAILGGSGSGKTTLLNTMAERMTSARLSQSGTTTFNGSLGVHSARHAYVMQQDILLPTLTVRETLRYSADLRLPPSTSVADRARIVEEVILELGLKECANTRIGNSQHRGCSGGEKRRVSIGVQMLANPSVLFLDEPTTGLDATSAFQLVRTLKNLAKKGRTIITTIHQPRSEIWDLFDNLILLTRGSPVYSGSVKDCLAWFQEQGFELPPFVNPAEFVIDISAVDNRTPELEGQSTARVERLKASWAEQAEKQFPMEKAVEPLQVQHRSVEEHATFLRQVQVLTDRTLKTTIRDPMGLSAAAFEVVIMAIATGYIFYNIGRDQAGIRSREGALYISAGLQGYLFLLFEIYRLTVDIPTFDRENSEGCSDALPFLLSRRLARLITEDFPAPFVYSCIFYFMAGFERSATQFFTFFAICLLNHYIAITCAMTCVATVRNFPGASLIANLVYTLQSMACGYFIQSNQIPPWTRWLKYLTYTYYVLGAFASNEFENSFYDCPYEGGEDNPACLQYTGRYILDSLGVPENWLAKAIGVLVAFVVFFFLLSFIGLKFKKVEMTISRARVSEADLSAGKEKMNARSIAEVRTIDVGLDNFALDLDKRTAWGKKLPSKTILEPVTTTFQAGVLNIIMGPSGSGKTSLLNAMALRLDNGIGTRYRPSGKLTFNGAQPSASVIRSVCSYVCQDDDALLPSLTVRETLRFAAALRLPSWMSKEEKHKRAEEVLLKMGLKDCADNLVGNELVKGISGGEKRRVTIAVQILTDPRILLLDEPTSGLDAFTASSIMDVLEGLANEGRTLILTIHQARSDLFKHFGNVLLLARGGSPAYAGTAKEMLGYFSRQGYDCPTHTNPADFALDLITIDLQEEEREAETRQIVKTLIDSWKTQVESDPAAIAAAEKTPLPAIKEEEPTKISSEQRPPVAEPSAEGEAQTESGDTNIIAPISSEAKPQRLIPATRQSFNKSSLATPAELGALVRKRTSFTTAVPILTHRAIINFSRQPDLLMARTMQVIGLGIVLTLFVAPFKSDYYAVQTRVGFIQQMGALYFVGMLQNVAVYPAERDVFYREADDGVYGVEAFMAVYTALELPFELISALVFALMSDLAVGLPRTAEMYFVAAFLPFAIVSCGESVGIMFNTLFSHTGFAVNLTSVVLSVSQTMGGIMSIDMPRLFQIFNYISPIRYGVLAFAPFSLAGVEFTCTDAQRLPGGECPITTGQQVLELYKLDVNGVVNIGALAGCMVVYRLVAWGLLRLVRTKWKGRKTKEEMGVV